jgi:competence protein ComEC
VFLDVGQGDACALGFPDGSWWLVDAGPRSPLFDAGENVVVPFLRWAGVRELETVAITHADADHIGGTAAVLRALPARRLLLPAPTRSVPGPWSLYHGARSRAVARGDTVRPLPAVVVVWPPREGPGREPADARLGATAAAEATPGAVRFDTDNRRCLVLRVQDALLLTGDADTLVERELTAEPPVALLKVAHHGSASSTGAAWLDAVRPAWALVSCGRDNPFGHPHPAVVRRLEERGVAIWRTDREGAAWLEWDGRAWRSLAWRGRDGLRSPPAAQAAVPGGMGGLADRANALAGPERAR